jgi:cysteine desulfuration protein SufE
MSIDAIIREFREIEDQDVRFDLLIECADKFVEVPESVARRPFPKANLTPACESEAYCFVTPNPDGTVKLHFAVENPQGISAKALAVILDENLSGKTPEEVQRVPEDIVYDIFGRTISMGKGQGLMGMVQLVKFLCAKL